MGFSPEWESKYRASGGMSQWPWSDLITQFKRHVRRDPAGLRVLELGCAIGANIPFFAAIGADYHGIEGSASMVADLLARFPSLAGKVAAADFTSSVPFEGRFDVIVDRSSLTHNTTASIRRCLAMLRERMHPGARFIGIDWFSTAHSDAGLGTQAEDPHTRKDIPAGQFAGVGRVHFSDASHLRDLFSAFQLEALEHKRVERVLPVPASSFASWNLVAARGED
jgi:SAM-dependent methyltransferase